MSNVRTRLRQLMREKADREGRRLNYETVAAETGMSYSTVANWSTNKVSRFDEKQIIDFCRYFECELSDLLVLVGEDEDTPETESPLTAFA